MERTELREEFRVGTEKLGEANWDQLEDNKEDELNEEGFLAFVKQQIEGAIEGNKTKELEDDDEQEDDS